MTDSDQEAIHVVSGVLQRQGSATTKDNSVCSKRDPYLSGSQTVITGQLLLKILLYSTHTKYFALYQLY